jgi:hypothetical protein
VFRSLEESCVGLFFFYKLSANKRPQHGLFPSGDDNWCKFKGSVSSGVEYQPKHSILSGVMDAIRPVFCELAIVDILKRCLHGKIRI